MKQTAPRRFLTRLALAATLLLVAPVLVTLVLAPAPLARADDDDGGSVDADDDHETARKALERREILPLGKVLALVEGQFKGDVIEIELERKKGIWIYDLELIDEDGRVREIDVDARTGEVLKVEYDE